MLKIFSWHKAITLDITPSYTLSDTAKKNNRFSLTAHLCCYPCLYTNKGGIFFALREVLQCCSVFICWKHLFSSTAKTLKCDVHLPINGSDDFIAVAYVFSLFLGEFAVMSQGWEFTCLVGKKWKISTVFHWRLNFKLSLFFLLFKSKKIQ